MSRDEYDDGQAKGLALSGPFQLAGLFLFNFFAALCSASLPLLFVWQRFSIDALNHSVRFSIYMGPETAGRDRIL